jgi:hypothetical protein
LNSKGTLPEEAWPTQVTESKTRNIELEFEMGELISVDGEKMDHPTKAIQKVQLIAGAYGIGRDIHIGDTIIGIKGRVGFEAAAPMIIIKAHHALEKHVLTKWQLNWKDQLALFYGNWLHEGQILDPVMRDMEAFLESTQQNVTGKVFVELMPYRFQITGIESKYDLMSSKFGKYGEMNNGWTGEDVRGFTKIFGNQTMIYHQIKQNKVGEKKIEMLKLVDYISYSTPFQGTKQHCRAGGCGVCAVMISYYDSDSQSFRNVSVNSCLRLLVQCDGIAIWTTEGIKIPKVLIPYCGFDTIN